MMVVTGVIITGAAVFASGFEHVSIRLFHPRNPPLCDKTNQAGLRGARFLASEWRIFVHIQKSRSIGGAEAPGRHQRVLFAAFLLCCTSLACGGACFSFRPIAVPA